MKALVTGITGQTGSYLAELLVESGYEVHGTQRRTSTITTERITKLHDKHLIETHYADLADTNSLVNILVKVKPDLIFNIGSQSHVKVSFDLPEYTAQVTGLAPLRLLEAIRSMNMNCRFLQASSSEMYGDSLPPQNEKTVMNPQSPYGCSKLFGYGVVRLYRSGYKMFACNSICFNHESPRRGRTFVTQKIVHAAVRIKLGLQESVSLGNLEAYRDWGHAKDYARAQMMIINHTEPDDFVVATGFKHNVREFAEVVFNKLGMDFHNYCKYDPQYFRPNEVPALCGDSTKLRNTFGWKPEYSFSDLVEDMIEAALREEKHENNRT
jgi:GDPmannose 4,6-dehydratase